MQTGIMKHLFGIFCKLCLGICLVVLQGCGSPEGTTDESPSKQAVMQALTKACGEEVASKHLKEWMEEYEIPSESDLDSTVCSEILEQIKQGNLSPEMMKHQILATRERLLGQIDHPRLLIALREIMRSRRGYKHDPNWKVSAWSTVQNDVTCISGADKHLPSIVLDLHADSLVCRDEMITAEFQPGFKNMGFIAYAEGVDSAPNGAGEKYQKVIDGLWFYETE